MPFCHFAAPFVIMPAVADDLCLSIAVGIEGKQVTVPLFQLKFARQHQNGRDYGLGAGGALCVFAEGADNDSWYELCIRQTRRKIG